jgi:hypothetical protein
MASGRTPGPTGLWTDPAHEGFQELGTIRGRQLEMPGPLGLRAKGLKAKTDGGGGSGGVTVSTAAVLIGPIGRKIPLVQDFYRGCTLEVIGPGSVRTGAVETYSTLEDLCDKMLVHDETSFVIVNHGDPEKGLILRFTAKSPHSATGLIIGDLAAMSKVAASLRSSDARVIDAASKMGVQRDDALRLISKLAELHKKQRLLFFRGCNIGKDLTMLVSYRDAFGAASAQAPDCRMFYQLIKPHTPSKGQTIAALSKRKPLGPKTRRRSFTDSTSRLGPLIIDVQDIDGHTNVTNESFADDPTQAAQWGAKILPEWRSVMGQNQFVTEVLWDDTESSYMTPLDVSYRQRLVFGQ